jgi:[acyl-carrier-protein] S-malonyltransferase
VLRRLVRQVSNPVRWDLCQQTFKDLGVTGLIEIPPAGTLANLAKRALPDVEVLAVKTPDDIAAARAMIKTHGEPSHLQANPTWRLVVAPAKGTVQFTGFEAGSNVDAGAEIARVETLRDTYPVVAPHGGQVIEWLVEDGDPVAPGQPLLRLHPVEVPASS